MEYTEAEYDYLFIDNHMINQKLQQTTREIEEMLQNMELSPIETYEHANVNFYDD